MSKLTQYTKMLAAVATVVTLAACGGIVQRLIEVDAGHAVDPRQRQQFAIAQAACMLADK